MKSFIIIFSFVFINCSSIFSQNIDTIHQKNKNHLIVYAGMGLGYTSTPSFNDYLRSIVAGGIYDSVKSFSVGIEIFGGLDYQISKKFSIGIDYSYFLKGGTYNYANYYVFDYSYHIHQPYLVGNYIISGNNYNFRLGAGAGYHFAQFTRTDNSAAKYNSSGFAIRGEMVFSTKLSSHLNTYIGAFLNGSFIGVLKDSGGNSLKNSITNKDVNLGGFGVGVRLGFSINIL